MKDPLAPTSFRSWGAGVLRVLRRSGPTVLAVQLVVVVAGWLLQVLLQAVGAHDLAESGPMSVVSVGEIATPLVQGVLTLFALAFSVVVIVRDAAGRPRSVPATLAPVRRRFLPLLGWGLVAGVLFVAVAAVAVLFAFLTAMSWAADPGGVSGLAIAVLVVVGLVLAYLAVVIGAPFAGVVVVEGGGPRRMIALAHSRFLAVLARTAVVGVLIVATYTLATTLATLPFDGLDLAFPGEPVWWASQALYAVAVVPGAAVGIAALVVLYGELRAAEAPGTGATDHADRLDGATTTTRGSLR